MDTRSKHTINPFFEFLSVVIAVLDNMKNEENEAS